MTHTGPIRTESSMSDGAGREKGGVEGVAGNVGAEMGESLSICLMIGSFHEAALQLRQIEQVCVIPLKHVIHVMRGACDVIHVLCLCDTCETCHKCQSFCTCDACDACDACETCHIYETCNAGDDACETRDRHETCDACHI